MRQVVAALTIGLLGLQTPFGALAQQTPQQTGGQTSGQSSGQTSGSTFTLSVNTNLVLTNVVVRDKKTGELVKGFEGQRLYRSWRIRRPQTGGAASITRMSTRQRSAGGRRARWSGQGFDRGPAGAEPCG